MMIGIFCIIFIFLIFYLLHQTDDSLGIVKIYREFINLPYVDVCYHNCYNPADLKKISNVKDNQSSDNEKLTINTCANSNEHQSTTQNSLEKNNTMTSGEITNTTQTNTTSTSEVLIKSQLANTFNDNSNKEKSVYLSPALRKHLK
uniref:EEV126 n=1 Tax=Strongyloides stercoralis TaxID=6248 RepID=A0A0K0DTH8_STRER